MSIPVKSGVYQIICTATGKVYVGSANNLQLRWLNHQSELNRGIHHNAILQRAWKKYGADAFVFSILEFVRPEQLVEREQYWIDATGCYKRDKGFNILSKARSALGMKMLADIVEKHRLRFSKVWEGFIDPHGNEVPAITNLSAFCRAHGLSPSAMQNIAKNHPHFKSHKGWTHKNSSPRLPKASPPKVDNSTTWEGFIDPYGSEVAPIKNLTAFCREHGLEVANMRQLAYGKRQSHKGWTHVNAMPYKTKPHK